MTRIGPREPVASWRVGYDSLAPSGRRAHQSNALVRTGYSFPWFAQSTNEQVDAVFWHLSSHLPRQPRVVSRDVVYESWFS